MKEIACAVEITVYLYSHSKDLVKNKVSETVIKSLKDAYPDWNILVLGNDEGHLYIRINDNGTGRLTGIAKEIKDLVEDKIKQMGYEVLFAK
jgi:hypothetical protein